MKIVDIKATTVNVPFEAPYLWSWGAIGGTTRTVVQVYTDGEVLGIGETRGGEDTRRQINGIKKLAIGEDPFDLERILSKFDALLGLGHMGGWVGYDPIAGIEMACWDVIGKTLDKPLYKLIGGLYRKEIPMVAYIRCRHKRGNVGGEKTPQDLVRLGESLINKYGFDTIKLSGGVSPPREEIETIKELRETFGDEIKLRIDGNAVWSPQTTLRICKALEKYGLEWVEDPVWGLEAMARVRDEVTTPFATNMHVTNFDHIPLAIRLGATDIILGDCHIWGGIWAIKKLAAVCEAFYLGMGMHTAQELGFSTAANLHIAASTPTIRHSVDSVRYYITDDIVEEKLEFRHGRISVPEKPGLGVKLDEDKFERYAELNKKEGDYTMVFDTERPDWIPSKNLW